MNGIQIASSIVRGELDDLCPENIIKCKIVKKVGSKRVKLSQELGDLDLERQYTLYKPFNNDLELAKLYVNESPLCVEIFSLFESNNLIVKTKAISMLLFILSNFSNLYTNFYNNLNNENNLSSSSDESSEGGLENNVNDSDGNFELSKKVKLVEKILKLYKEKIDEIFVNDDVIINYSLKLLLECVKCVDLDALTEFLLNFNFFKYLTKCHIFTPSCDITLINSLNTDESAVTDEISSDADLYHENGKLKLCIILLLGLKGVNVLRKDLINIIVSHLKSEQLTTQFLLVRLLVKILNNLNEVELDEYTDKLFNNINNVIIILYKELGTEFGTKLNKEDLDDILKDFIKFIHKYSDLCVKLILKYDIKTFKVVSTSLYTLNNEAYKSYVNSLKLPSNTEVGLFLDIVEEFYDNTNELPNCFNKVIINKLLTNNVPIINKLIKLLIKVNSLPDLQLLLKLINHNNNNDNTVNGVDADGVNSSKSVDLSGLLELLSRFDGAKSIFDPLKLFKYPSISSNYEIMNEFFTCKTDMGVSRESDGRIEDRLELDKSLMKCIYNLSVKDIIIINKLQNKCLSILLQRYIQTLNYSTDYNCQLLEFIKSILNNVIDSNLTEIYITNLTDKNITNLFIILYNLLLTLNIQLLYQNSSSNRSNQLSDVSTNPFLADDMKGEYSCVGCVLKCYFKGDLYLLMLLVLLIQLKLKVHGTKVKCVKCNGTSVNLVKSISDNKSYEKCNDWENVMENYVLKVLANVLTIPCETSKQLCTILTHYDIQIEPIEYKLKIEHAVETNSQQTAGTDDTVNTVDNTDTTNNVNVEVNLLNKQMLQSLIDDKIDKTSLVKCAKQLNTPHTKYFIQTLIYTHQISIS
ncbi:uncharacterized protein TA14245 [Theileria annulata]|uniref:Uncharacterized protein n=1 Tax=Theileria annulata TaxID=5874 RepID=Q4UEY4_THEAN|nr:uncharacterized protein TA14245 [Theileria annulata]CAI74355.1 hypothetical protein TA14245 [Theileria annulata]|eukprot:XP_952087.1 hypothetical protein TA14245 [Theileria annulata]